MIVPALRLVAGWLTHATVGVNARLAAMVLATGDSVPPDVAVYEETSTGWVARLEVPQEIAVTTPVLTVHLAGDVTIESAGENYGQGERVVTIEVPVGLLYFRRLGDTEVATAGAWYTLEAAHEAIRSVHFSQAAALTKDLANLRAMHLVSWRVGPVRDLPGDLPVLASATATIAFTLTLPVS